MSFTPVERDSLSIPQTLLSFSKERELNSKHIDFELVHYDTVIKRDGSEENIYIEDIRDITEEDISNPYTQIYQEYRIRIIPVVNQKEPIQISLATNKLKTKAIVTIKKGSVFTNGEAGLKKLKKQIWMKKLRAGLLINIFEDTLNQQLKKLFKVVPQNKPLSKDLKITVALGIEPTLPIDEKYDKVFETITKDTDSIIDGVGKDVLILKYFKPKIGVDGRSCTGKFLQMREPFRNYPEPKIDETIRKKEFDDFIDFYSNDTGYVILTKTDLKISKQLKLDGADFKSAANIDSGEEDKDISVHIGHSKGESEDAIGSGVKIDVKELNVEGSVAGGVKIATQELNIDAQTHKNAKMEVENTANIQLHRGDLVAKEANIQVLESGKVTAHDKIYVKQMLGGTAIAPIVKVDELLANSTIIASELIEITTITGQDNKLIINPHAIESYHKDVEELKEQISELKKTIYEQTKILNMKEKDHASRAERVKTFQKRVLLATKSGKAPVKQDMIRIKQFKKETETLQAEQAELFENEKEMEKLSAYLDKLYNKELHAEIKCESSYDGTSRVIFINSKTKEEIPYVPEGMAATISLIENDEGDRIVRVV